MEKTLGKLIGSYMTENIPLMTKIAIRLGLAQHRLARYYVSNALRPPRMTKVSSVSALTSSPPTSMSSSA